MKHLRDGRLTEQVTQTNGCRHTRFASAKFQPCSVAVRLSGAEVGRGGWGAARSAQSSAAGRSTFMYAALSNDIQLQGRDGAGLIARCRKDARRQLHKCESGRIARIADKVHEATKKGLWQELRAINGVAVSRASNAVKAVVSKDGVSVLTEPVEVLERSKEHYADLAARSRACFVPPWVLLLAG
jgi:hypothetical protein